MACGIDREIFDSEVREECHGGGKGYGQMEPRDKMIYTQSKKNHKTRERRMLAFDVLLMMLVQACTLEERLERGASWEMRLGKLCFINGSMHYMKYVSV